MAELEAPSQAHQPTTGVPATAPDDRPESVDALREDIEQTRARLSNTLDQIEDRLVRRKQAVWATATLQGLRERFSREPWRSMGIAFIAGYLVAALRD